jgi:hypothetical protein
MPFARAAVVLTTAASLTLLVQPAIGADRARPVPITFDDLAPASRGQRFLPRTLALNGHLVRITGYVAAMEQPLEGTFYLCPVPLFLDEGGAGTGDLPPDAVRVSVAGRDRWTLPSVPRPVDVVGRLDLGYREEPDGQVSWVRLRVELPAVSAPLSR